MSIIWLLQLLRASLLPLAIAGSVFLGYSKVKDIGYQEASAKYESIISEHVRDNQEKLDNLEKLSTKLVKLTSEAEILNTKNINRISEGLKGKSLVIIKDGECKPSPTFLGSFEEINKRVNESIQGIQP